MDIERGGGLKDHQELVALSFEGVLKWEVILIPKVAQGEGVLATESARVIVQVRLRSSGASGASREERLELEVGDKLDGLRRSMPKLTVALFTELVIAVIEIPGALKYGVCLAVCGDVRLTLLLANVGEGEPGGTHALWILVDNRWRAA